jgi:chromosome segregation ATPase
MKFQTLHEVNASEQIERERVARESKANAQREHMEKLTADVSKANERLGEAAAKANAVTQELHEKRRQERELVASCKSHSARVEQTRRDHGVAKERPSREAAELETAITAIEAELNSGNLPMAAGVEKANRLAGLIAYRKQSWQHREKALRADADDAGQRVVEAEKALQSKADELATLQAQIRATERELAPLEAERAKRNEAFKKAEAELNASQ